MRDWHIHLERGPYTIEWAEHFVRRAEKLGIREICLLEHSVRFFEFHPTFAQARAYNDYQQHWFDEKVQTARHLDEFKRFGDRLRAKNYPVKIKLGLEICYFPQHADVIEQVTRAILIYCWAASTGSTTGPLTSGRTSGRAGM